MKKVEGVKIVLQEGNPHYGLQIFFKVEGEPIDMAAKGSVWWPVDIHIDEKGAVATLKVPIVALEVAGVAIIEEPEDEYK